MATRLRRPNQVAVKPGRSSGYSGQSVTLSAGVNAIVSSGSSFGAVVYGWGAPGSYNGFCFAPRAAY